MKAGVPKELASGERRVALVPGNVAALTKAGVEILVEAGAGVASGYRDAEYESKGATIVATRQELFHGSDMLLTVQAFDGGAIAQGRAASDLSLLKKGQALMGSLDPLSHPSGMKALAETGVTAFSLELMPRITRAQSMDILSSMATIAGYKAVLLAADALPRMCPMLMTAAGTLSAARCFVVGAGVAGLQAIATARRLGCVVEAYDVRPAVKEQVQSLGAKFVELELETGAAEDAGGYAKELGDDFYRKQREMMKKVVAECDIVITTAAIPGRKAPVLVTAEMVEGMKAGSVVVDLAAERGGNCEVTRAGESVEHAGVTVIGPLNVPASIPYHASQMFGKNVTTFLLHLVKDGALALDREDEITSGTLVAHEGEVVHPRVKEALEGPAQEA